MTQAEALEILKSGSNVFLTGEPGSGKSYTINKFVEWANMHGVYPAITASTGIAATHIGGVTIHSWSGIGIKKEMTKHDLQMLMSREYVVQRILSTRVLIIDEVSMLDGRTLDTIDKVLRYVINDDTKPFGGIQVIFVGDFFQLPPVSKNEPATFAFESQAWLNASPRICYLTEQHRQDDPEFLETLTAMRNGKLTPDDKYRLLKKRRTAPEGTTRIYTHNADVDALNESKLAQLPGKLHRYHMRSDGIPFLVDVLKKNCLSPEALELKVGAPVMFTRNEGKGLYVNGTLGKVVSFTETDSPVIETKDGTQIVLDEPQEWSIVERGYKKASIRQLPLRLAWAITVHKCQGMSLDAARIDLGGAFEYGQGYVALSRVRSLDGLYLDALNDMALQMHPVIVEKDALFRKLSGI